MLRTFREHSKAMLWLQNDKIKCSLKSRVTKKKKIQCTFRMCSFVNVLKACIYKNFITEMEGMLAKCFRTYFVSWVLVLNNQHL